MATSAQIIPFGSWRAPTPANTVEGKFYLRQKSRLTVDQRRRLRSLEEDLFRGCVSLENMGDILNRPWRLHDVPGLGFIVYFWSRADHLYVLTEFGFEADGAGGGVPCSSPLPKPPCGGTCRPPRRRIAATARSGLISASRSAASFLVALLGRLRPLAPKVRLRAPLSWMAGRCMVRHRYQSVELANEVLAVHSLLAGDGPVECEELPDWSLLRELVTVPEELHNPLARSLVAGELVCRLGSVADEAWRATSRHGWLLYMSGIDSRWSAHSCRSHDEDPHRLDALISTWLSDDGDRSVEGDVLRLLARARLSLVLTSHVRRSALAAASGVADAGAFVIAPSKRLQLRKIQLVSEYVALSYAVWPANHRWCAWSEDPTAAHDPRSLFKEFDRSVGIIARQIERPGRSGELSGTMRDRITAIVAEIVAPVTSD